MKRILLITGMLFILSACSGQQTQVNDLLKMKTLRYDPAIETGTLNNGFRYFLAENSTPEKKVYIRLVVNAGSMNEDDDQRGVAHIVEHMAFNGTTHFPGNKLIRDLEKAGLKFGIDINAFTDFENTVYTLNLPDNDPVKINLALDIVADWAGRVTINQADLDAERGVVLEEWRARLGAMLRLGDKKSAIEMAGSRYALRDPIGDAETIQNVSRKRVADFYYRWYRPDNMSLVVAGDINKQHILSLLKTKLTMLPVRTDPPEMIDYSVPLPEHWRTAFVHEDEIRTPAVEISFFSPYQEDYSLARYKDDLVNQIMTRLINIRLQYLEKENDEFISTANYYSSATGRETIQSVFSLQLSDEKYDEATLSIFNFLATVEQQGFTQAELDEELERLTRLNEKQKDKTIYSIDLAADMMTAAASHQLLAGQNDKFLLNRYYLKNITLADVNSAFHTMTAVKSRLVMITHPEKIQPQAMDAAALEKNWIESHRLPQKKWDPAAEQITELPDINVTAGSVKLIRTAEEYNIREYQLSNGSRLIYQYNNDNPGKVFFKALTPGGLRSVPDDDYHALRIAVSLTDETGFGRYPLSALQAVFNKSPVVMSTLLDEHQQGFSGWAETDNLEKILTLFHLKLNESRVTEKVWRKYKSEMDKQLAENNKDSQHLFMQKISSLRYPGKHTIYDATQQDLDVLSAEKLTQLYERYISNKTDFTYFITGDIQPRDAEKIAGKYLASVGVKKDGREPVAIEAGTPETPLIVRGLQEPRAEVEIYLVRKNGWRPDNAYYLEIGGEVIQEKLREKLREEASGVYSVTAWFWHNPSEIQDEGRIMFTCAPERVDELIALSERVLTEFEHNGIDRQVFRNKIVQSRNILERTHNSVTGILEDIERSYMLTGGPLLIGASLRANEKASPEETEMVLQDFLRHAGKFHAVLLPAE